MKWAEWAAGMLVGEQGVGVRVGKAAEMTLNLMSWFPLHQPGQFFLVQIKNKG